MKISTDKGTIGYILPRVEGGQADLSEIAAFLSLSEEQTKFLLRSYGFPVKGSTIPGYCFVDPRLVEEALAEIRAEDDWLPRMLNSSTRPK